MGPELQFEHPHKRCMKRSSGLDCTVIRRIRQTSRQDPLFFVRPPVQLSGRKGRVRLQSRTTGEMLQGNELARDSKGTRVFGVYC